ncbi:AAA family ATPase [Myxococcus sp. CA033]|uniref:DEAD/DEAH box helicase n=1 Tax=Myxococcaceae TaxID=31 RepID=UPI000EA39F02|nr:MULTISPECIES: AAA domain-containing protein [Myxococcaceae]NTX39161.1 AAA family ATPase [Myxococcus sp. CA033]RKG56896.1 DNA/RNA helicase [Corallococcus sp. AB011P]
MNIHDLVSGAVSTIEVAPSAAADFDVAIEPRAEATIQFSDVTGDALLRVGASAWSVVGVDQRASEALQRLRDRNLPRVAWVASVRPLGKKSEAVLLQVHEFPARYDWPDHVDIAVDDKIVEQVRQKLGRSVSASEVTQWLSDRFLLLAADGSTRVFLSGSPTPETDQRGAFRLHGRGYAIDIAKGRDDKLLITRLVEAKLGRSPDERRPVVLILGHVRFCDATIAGVFRGTARTQLDQLVEQAGSYLNIWRDYNKLERESVLRRARTLGWLRYGKRQLQGDGRWRFFVEDTKQLETALEVLRNSEDVDLEAAQNPPPELQQATDEPLAAVEEPASRAPRSRIFVGAFSGAELHRRAIDLQPPLDSDDREPPESGVLFLSVSGDRKRLERREHAQSLIASAACPMPQLGLLLEGSAVPERRRKIEDALSQSAREVFGGEPTARQIEALRVALNTPDIALIQGPPGTGKTKTIAALEARLAELSEDDLAGQTLLTSYQHDAVENAASRTLVFGLPAIKVGRKRGTTDQSDGFDRWRRERADAVRADLAMTPERPVTEALRKVRTMAAAYIASPLTADESLRVVRDVQDLCRSYVPPSLNDRLEVLRQELSRSPAQLADADDDERALALKAVRALRIEAAAFGDDGPRNAGRALIRLKNMGLFDEAMHRVLTDAAEWTEDNTPPFLAALKSLQDALVDQLAADNPVGAPLVHGDLESLLPEIVDALYSKARESAGGEDAVLYEYLNDLEHDVDGVRDAVRDYTVVLAATCQQSVGFQMSQAKGADTVFANVIVDEAARANPLDLFIPMSRAERRIILVGDHRQLPHILEPDIESQLEHSVTEATTTALRRSLFERLFQAMKEREAKDGIKRTVTLDQQYRMHPILGSFVSDTFYAPYAEGFASPRRAEEFVHDLPGYTGRVAAWVDMPLSRGREHGGQSKRRTAEAEWIAKEVERLATVRRDLSFGVISFYSAQADEVLEVMEKRGMSERLDDGSYRVKDAWRETRSADGRLIERLRVGTVDAFQGKEFDVVFLSMTRSNDLPVTDERSLRRKFGHLMLENRLCVAMSRQQRLLIVVGDAAMLRGEASEKALRGLVAFRELCGGKHGLAVSA